MPYHVIDATSIEATPDRPCTRRPIGETAGLERLALNRYEVAPGEQIPLAYHYHDEQEEAFYVLDGRLHVETPEREYAVEADEVFLAEPASPHRAYNPADAPGAAEVIAIGAPSVDDVHPYEPDGSNRGDGEGR